MMRLLMICLLLLSPLAQADVRIDTIELKHRLASEVAGKIAAVLPDHASVEAHGNLLILRADQVTLLDMRELVQQLDTPLQNLRITLLRTHQQLGELAGGTDQARIEYDEQLNARIRSNRWSTQQARDTDERYQVRTLSGQPVSLMIGQDVPLEQETIYLHGSGVIGIGQTTEFIALDKGFQAVANVLGNGQVQIDIHPAFADLQTRSGVIDRSAMLTSVSGLLGEWIAIGHVAEQTQQNQNGHKRYRSQLEQQQWLYLRVELQP